MTNAKVAHIWAHQQQESASGSNFFFEGRNIYSYGHHFEVGRIVVNRGSRIYLINSEKYSSTTSAHITIAESSIPRATKLKTKYISDEFEFGFVVERVQKIYDTLKKTRRAYTGIELIFNAESEIRICSDFFRWKPTNKSVGTWAKFVGDKELAKELKELFDRVLELGDFSKHRQQDVIEFLSGDPDLYPKYVDRVNNRRRGVSKSEEQLIEQWRYGKRKKIGVSNVGKGNVALRINEGKIETSKGIFISIDVAKRLWEAIKSFDLTYKVVDRNGAKYKIDYIGDTIVIGCHEIDRQEIDRLVTFFNW